MSVRPSIRPQSFSDFDLIQYVGRSRPHIHTSVTSARSKVVMELLKLQQLHFSRSISCAVLAWSSKLTVCGDSMGRVLQHVGARFLNLLLVKLSRQVKLRRMSIYH